LSASFHGRDLFAPIAAEIDRGAFPDDKVESIGALRVQLAADDLAQVIYVDHYGNALTGVRASNVYRSARLTAGDREIGHADVFGAVPIADVFWYENSIGLVEIAANRARAADLLGIDVGDLVELPSRR
jgi:S-adenosylmethionine hydrolase